MSDAPQRIWTTSTYGECHVGFSTPSLDYTNPYILATPEALAASPEVQALIAAAVADATRVKPLVWKHEARHGWKLGVAHAPGHHIMRRDDGWHYGNGHGGIFPTLEAAKAAADADHAARVRAAIGGDNE